VRSPPGIAGAKGCPCAGAKRPRAGRPLAVAGSDERGEPQHRDQRPLGRTRGDRTRALRLVQPLVHPIHWTPEADPDARLPRFNAAALRAPPCRGAVERFIPLTDPGLRKYVATQDDARCALQRPVGHLALTRAGRVARQLLDDQSERPCAGGRDARATDQRSAAASRRPRPAALLRRAKPSSSDLGWRSLWCGAGLSTRSREARHPMVRCTGRSSSASIVGRALGRGRDTSEGARRFATARGSRGP
jgi:hypothetical protein